MHVSEYKIIQAESLEKLAEEVTHRLKNGRWELYGELRALPAPSKFASTDKHVTIYAQIVIISSVDMDDLP